MLLVVNDCLKETQPINCGCDHCPPAYCWSIIVETPCSVQGVSICLTCDLQLIPVDVDGVLLAYPVRSGHGLQVVLGVPVAVKDDHCVSSGQVDAQPTCSGGQQEGEITRAWGIEVLHRLHTMTPFA